MTGNQEIIFDIQVKTGGIKKIRNGLNLGSPT